MFSRICLSRIFKYIKWKEADGIKQLITTEQWILWPKMYVNFGYFVK